MKKEVHLRTYVLKYVSGLTFTLRNSLALFVFVTQNNSEKT